MTFLLVMWMVVGQPPQAYQVQFNSPAACARAKTALQQEADRLNREPPVEVAGQQIVPFPVRLSAICVAAG